MVTFRVSVDVPESRCVEVKLPAEVAAGKVDLVVHVMPSLTKFRRRRLPLAQWADRHEERWTDKMGAAK
jgi:hypothetical protein